MIKNPNIRIYHQERKVRHRSKEGEKGYSYMHGPPSHRGPQNGFGKAWDANGFPVRVLNGEVSARDIFKLC